MRHWYIVALSLSLALFPRCLRGAVPEPNQTSGPTRR